MTLTMSVLIAIVIGSLFLVPALVRPNLGRVVLSLMFLGGAALNLLYTLPNAPASLFALVATAPIPPYREVVDFLAERNATSALALATVIFEALVGLLILGRGLPARVALLSAGLWGVAMLPVERETKFGTASLPVTEQRHLEWALDFGCTIKTASDFQPVTFTCMQRRANVVEPS